MPTLHSHTHCQVAQAKAQTKTWQRVCLSHRTTDRQSGRKTEGQQLTAVWRNGGFSASIAPPSQSPEPFSASLNQRYRTIKFK